MKPKLRRKEMPWSYSQISTYLQCPYLYSLRYVQRIKSEPKSAALEEGKLVHRVLETRHRNIFKKDPVPLEQVIQEEKLRIVGVGIDWQQEDTNLDEMTGRARKFAELYEDYNHIPFDQNSIEQKVEGTVAGVPVIAYLDLVRKDQDGNPVIVDYKVSSRAKSEAEAEDGLQCGIYSLLTGIPRVELISFVKNKTPKTVHVQAMRTKKSLERTERVVESVVNAIDRHVFPFTDPTNWCCNEKFCDMWAHCPQGGKEK